MSKAIARLLLKQDPNLRILLINSETSNSEWEWEFMQSPDAVLQRDEYEHHSPLILFELVLS